MKEFLRHFSIICDSVKVATENLTFCFISLLTPHNYHHEELLQISFIALTWHGKSAQPTAYAWSTKRCEFILNKICEVYIEILWNDPKFNGLARLKFDLKINISGCSLTWDISRYHRRCGRSKVISYWLFAILYC